jgi:hypothetical protein
MHALPSLSIGSLLPTTLLAQSSGFSASTMLREADLISRPDALLEQLSRMPAIVAVVVAVVGAICVVRGYMWHRWIVILLAAMLGLGLGHFVSEQVGRSGVIAISMGLLFAAIASPMLRWTVAVFAGLAGAFIGANVWSIVQGADAGSPWPGAAMGFILLALSSFLIFRVAIILFTALGGAAMLVIGAIASLLHIDAISAPVQEHLQQHQLIVPLLVGIAAVGGFILQESWTRSAPKEEAE